MAHNAARNSIYCNAAVALRQRPARTAANMHTDFNLVLQDDEFWTSAFVPDLLFRKEVLSEFRRGLLEASESDLAWARLAMYGIRNEALWPITLRLLHLATRLPNAEFVESLAFFLSNEETIDRMKQNQHLVSTAVSCLALADIKKLQVELCSRGDGDLSSRLDGVCEILQGISRGPATSSADP